MNFDRNISSTQITWIVGLLLGLGLAFVLGTAIGQQDFRKVSLIIGAGIGIAVFLALGKNYWLLIPLSLGAKFPAVPLGGRTLEFPELCIAGCSLMFILRVATRKEKMRLFVPINTPFLLFMAWVGMVFLIHPIGFSMLGASVGGGRFYVKLALALASFVVLSNRHYSESDVRKVVGLMLFGALFSACYGIAEYFLMGGPQADASGYIAEEFYSWHQVLSVPAMTGVFLVFSRWSPREVFSLQHMGIAIGLALCFALVLLSGKRMALAAVFAAPVVSAVMFKQYRYIVLALVFSVTLAFVLAGGQGHWFKLPLVAQRTLSWLPGAWDAELDSLRGGTDDFRTELRRMAAENIKADPIIGQGYAMNMGEILTTMTLQKQIGGLEIVTAGHAISRNWHNVWLGYAADFGIPLSLMQAAIFLTVLTLSSRNFRNYRNRSYLGVFSLYVLIFTVRDMIASWTSGHTSVDAFDRWWMYGIIVAIYLQWRAGTKSAVTIPSLDSLQSTSTAVRSLNPAVVNSPLR
jgi:hypothetical protein